MPVGNLKRGLDRLFLVLSAAWVLYWAVVFPLTLRSHRIDFAYRSYFADEDQCRNDRGTDGESCRQLAKERRELDLNKASLRNTYSEAWPSILIIGVAYPPAFYALLYGSVRGIRAICLWIWRGYKQN